MALPTSTIVMALVTAVPFGLAIKDTITGKPAYVVPGDDDSDSDASMESYERAQREYEEKQAKRAAELRSAIHALIPTATKAKLGVPHALLQPTSRGAELQDNLEDLAHAIFTPKRDSEGRLAKLTVSFPQYRSDENVCLLVSQRLDDAWGSASRTYRDGASRRHYLTTATTPPQRVTFVDPDDGERCELVLEPLVSVPDFIAKTDTATVPLWAIGKPAAVLIEKLGGDAFSDTTQILWTRPGVGEGLGETELYARIVKGKIVTVTAKFQASEPTIGALAQTLVTDHGEPTDSDPVVWKKAKLSLETLDDTAGEYLFVAGEPLPIDAGDGAPDEE